MAERNTKDLWKVGSDSSLELSFSQQGITTRAQNRRLHDFDAVTFFHECVRFALLSTHMTGDLLVLIILRARTPLRNRDRFVTVGFLSTTLAFLRMIIAQSQHHFTQRTRHLIPPIPPSCFISSNDSGNARTLHAIAPQSTAITQNAK